MSEFANAFSAWVTAAQLLVMVVAACIVWLNYNQCLLSDEKELYVTRMMLVASFSLILQSLAGHMMKPEFVPGPILSTIIGILGSLILTVCMFFGKYILVLFAGIFALVVVGIFYTRFENGEWYMLVAILLIIVIISAIYTPVRDAAMHIVIIIGTSVMIIYGSFDLHAITGTRKSFAQQESLFVRDSFGITSCFDYGNECKLRFILLCVVTGIRLLAALLEWATQIRRWCIFKCSSICCCCCGCCQPKQENYVYAKLSAEQPPRPINAAAAAAAARN